MVRYSREYWYGGKMEYWVSKADGVLILILVAGQIHKNRSHFAEPRIPTFHYFRTP
jgi:hypothetical protein